MSFRVQLNNVTQIYTNHQMVVEHWTYNPKMEGLNPASAVRELLLVSGERHLQKGFIGISS
jgi:hypothetical protein